MRRFFDLHHNEPRILRGPVGAAFAAVATWAASSTLGAAVVRIGLGIVLSAISRAIYKEPKRKQKFPGFGVEYTAGEDTPLTMVVGQAAVRGHALSPSYSTDLGAGGLPNKFLWRPTVLSDFPITEIEGAYVAGQWITFEDSITALHGRNAEVEPYVGQFYLDWALGSQTSANSIMMANFSGEAIRPWQSDMIGLNKAIIYPVFKASQDGEPFGRKGEPFPLYVVKGAPLYDRRTDTTAYTANPIVFVENVLRGFDVPGVGRWGLNVDEQNLPSLYWEASMDVCDEVDPVNGDIRYEFGMEFGLNQEPLEIIAEALKACGGDVANCGGVWRVTAGPPPSSIYSFTDGNVIITDGRRFAPFPGLAETFNGVSASYLDPRNAYQVTSAIPYRNATWEAEDGNRRLLAELQYPAVPFPRQVRRLMRELAKDNRRLRAHELTLPPQALHVMPLDTVTWTSEENSYSNKQFEVRAKTFDPITLLSRVAIKERDPNDYDWDSTFDDTLPLPPSKVPVDKTIYGVQGFDCVGSSIGGGAGDTSSERPTAYCTWTDTDLDGIEIEIRNVSSNQRVTFKTLGRGATKEGAVHITSGILPGQALKARAKAVARKRPTAWGSDVFFSTEPIGMGYDDLIDDIKKDIEDGFYEVENATRVARSLPKIETIFEGGLPTTGNFEGRMVFLREDGKLYKYTGGAWTLVIEPVDITGILTNDQIESIVASKLTGLVTSAQIQSLVTSKLSGFINDAQIAAVAAAKLTGQITTTQISNDAITTPKIAAAAVVTASLAAGSVAAGKVAADAIGANEIVSGAIITAKLAASAVTAGKIASSAVNTSELAASAVTAVKVAVGTLTGDRIAGLTITGDLIAGNTITGGKMVANTLTAGTIASGAIGTTELAASAVSAGKIAAAAVTASKISVSDLSAISANLGSIIVGTANIGSLAVTDLKLANGAVLTDKMALGAVHSYQIALDGGGTEDTLSFAGLTTDYVALIFGQIEASSPSGSSSIGVELNGSNVMDDLIYGGSYEGVMTLITSIQCVNGTNNIQLDSAGSSTRSVKSFVVFIMKR